MKKICFLTIKVMGSLIAGFFVLTICGQTLVSCSSSEDDFTEISKEETANVQIMRARVLKMAEEYGLNIELSPAFDEAVKKGDIDLKETAAEFKRMANVLGYYNTFATKKSKDIPINSALKNLKLRRAMNPSRDVYTPLETNQNVSANGKTFNVRFHVKWEYSANNDAISQLFIADDNEDVNYVSVDAEGAETKSRPVQSLNYNFSGSGNLQFAFSFYFKYTYNYYIYTFWVTGAYNSNSGQSNVTITSYEQSKDK